jgi:urate oxidase
MSMVIKEQAYGKSRVRLTRLRKQGERHSITEFTVEILLDGDFETAYTQADNSMVIPTDTVKNTVFALGRNWEGDQCEEFAMILTDHFLSFQHVSKCEVKIIEHQWDRITIDGKEHPHAFKGGNTEVRTCRLIASRTDSSMGNHYELTSGIDALAILKTTQSGFSDFFHDKFTTLQDTDDRIFASTITAQWKYVPTLTLNTVNFEAIYDEIRSTIIRECVARYSPSVQATLYEIATAVLESQSLVNEISLRMPNQHRLLVDLSKFSLDNPNLVFVATDEPHGTISATIARQ